MIIVTGGAGFIGSNLVRYLNSKGIVDILIVDDLTDSRKLMTLKSLKFTAYKDVEDINWKILGTLWIEKVFHCGGISSTTETNGQRLMKYNYTHTLSWAGFCAKEKIPLVYLSSASVYGNSQTFCETDELDPLNPYAVSKMLSEIVAEQPNVWVFRPFNVYGSGEAHKDAQQSPVSKFREEFAQTGRVTVFTGSENTQRDFICVDDVVKIIADYTNKNPGIYNLGCGHSRSFLEIAEMVTDNINTVPFPSHLVGKYQYYSKADLTKLRNNLIGDYQFILPESYK